MYMNGQEEFIKVTLGGKHRKETQASKTTC